MKIDLKICEECPMCEIPMRFKKEKPWKPQHICKIKMMNANNHKIYNEGWIEHGGWVPRQCYMRLEYLVLQQEEEVNVN